MHPVVKEKTAAWDDLCGSRSQKDQQYIKAYIVFGALTYTALFVFGLVLGMIVFMTQGHDAANGLDNQPWFGPLSQIMFFIFGFLSFIFSARKFIETNEKEQDKVKAGIS
tara:strand:- start:4575 stop:4904 length:330 start_codon:yes stop_codon:yes gene_type:complete